MKSILQISKCLTLVLVLICSGCALLAEEQREQEVFTQVYSITPDGSFNLSNVNGSVTVRAWEQPTLQLTATKRGPSKENMDLVKIEINADPTQFSIDTVYPKGKHNLNVSVSYEISIPKTVRLRDIKTVNGSVEIDGMVVEVDAHTVNGSIKVLNSSGRVSAETVNGSLTAELNQIDPNADMKFETVNGSIKVYLPDRAGADIDAGTVNGGLDTDFPLAVQGKWGPKSMRGKVGAGGARIQMATVNGSVKLFRR